MTGRAEVGPKLSSPRSQWRVPAREPPWAPLCGADPRGHCLPPGACQSPRPPTGQKGRLTSPHLVAALRARRCRQRGLRPAPHARDRWGLGFPSGELIFFFLIGLLKYYKARGSPPIPWWHSREPSTPSGTNTEQVSRSLKNRFKFPTREFSIRSFVLFFFFFFLLVSAKKG